MVAAVRSGQRSRPDLRVVLTPLSLPWLVLAGGLLTTGLFCNSERRFNQLEHERIERTITADVAEAIQARFKTTNALLDAVMGLFNAAAVVDRQAFATFFRSLSGTEDNLKGVLGVGYAAAVRGGAVSAFEQAIRRDDQPDFRIRPAGERALMAPVTYLQPNNWRNRRAIGFDMASESIRREALRQAASTGEATLTAPVRLVQETNVRPQPGTLLYRPIYHNPGVEFSSSSDPLRRLRGWAYAPLRMGDLINGALDAVSNPDKVGTAIIVYDGNQPLKHQLLYDSQDLADHVNVGHFTWRRVSVANRTWLIGAQLDHRRLNPAGWSPELMLTGLLGLSLSALMAMLTRQLVDNHIALGSALLNEQDAARERALAATVFEASPEGIAITDPDAIILRVNRAFCQISGYAEQELRGRKTNILKSGRHDQEFYQQLWQTLLEKGAWAGEVWNRHRNGAIRRHDLTITAVYGSDGAVIHYVELLRDITERHSEEERVYFQATHDQLTGLANRSLLMEELVRSLALARRYGRAVGVLFLDLNGFKPVNDACGHSCGDVLLQAVAARLLRSVRESDTVSRLGGDEFVLLIPDAPAIEQLLELASKLQGSLTQPYPELPDGMAISASIGVARWPEHADEAPELLQAADDAMYRAKAGHGELIAVAERRSQPSPPSPPSPPSEGF